MAEEFETVELEYSEDDILYYIEDEDGTEIGFAILEDGEEVECYYEGFDADEYETVSEPVFEELEGGEGDGGDEDTDEEAEAEKPTEPTEHSYFYKMIAIAGHQGNKTRKKAGEKLEVARGKAETQYHKAKSTATEQASKAKEKAEDAGIDISREGVAEMTGDLNTIAKDSAETVKELKEAYDDIMENFGFLVPKKVRRRLP